MVTAPQPVGVSVIGELLGGVSLWPFPTVSALASPFSAIGDPAASWSAALRERRAEVAGGLGYLPTSPNKVYH